MTVFRRKERQREINDREHIHEKEIYTGSYSGAHCLRKRQQQDEQREKQLSISDSIMIESIKIDKYYREE